ncbi:MAG TPA: isoprenylcysteine carboxylmethyltransferase family protein [Gemmatimonadales bacterium]|jgi:protein-S-isoprenylcysteine O-methyltransferase Ste14|nr:isoprenylcysteine carboxylmethyltransferase family protein [Gemmatimonadales bacterium]
MISPNICTNILWAAWLLIWVLAASFTARTVIRQPLASRLAHGLWLWVGAALLFFVDTRRSGRPLNIPLLPPHSWMAWTGVGLVLAGLGHTVWARIHLGRMWSGTVTLKEEHALVRSGPYALTRHPIYTGLILALVGTVLVRDTLGALAGFALCLVGVILKIRQEERLLLGHFGDAYRGYQAEVPAVVPGLRF